MMQAVGAMLRGESPQAFLQNLAKTNPQLQGLDLTKDLDKTAEELYSNQGKNYNQAKADIKAQVSQFMNK